MLAWRTCSLAAVVLGLLTACTGLTPAASGGPATAAPPVGGEAASSCGGHATPAQTEGPFFKAGSPERQSLLEPGLSGTQLTLTGRVLTLGCQPVSDVALDFWQADASGAYDNRGYRLRGHQLTDAAGRYSLQTIVPGEYPGRTAHIHVKVRAPQAPVLTTQLYFPGVPRNQQDSIFDPALVMKVTDAPDGKAATFDFVLDH
jgi:protocatechuate 3,4-dioxygenase beta subunit